MNENDIFAFPRSTGSASGGDGGMTLRDWFAGQVLSNSGIIYMALRGFDEYSKSTPDDMISTYCYSIADAMIAQRKND